MNSKPFVGRKTELQLLESYASKTFEAELASVVFITGEAGMGKDAVLILRKTGSER